MPRPETETFQGLKDIEFDIKTKVVFFDNLLLLYVGCRLAEVGVKLMAQVTLEVGVQEIRELIFQLSPKELVMLMDEVEERAETTAMMQLAQTGFAEWDEPGEDIYDEA